jgi:hypothetical protein
MPQQLLHHQISSILPELNSVIFFGFYGLWKIQLIYLSTKGVVVFGCILYLDYSEDWLASAKLRRVDWLIKSFSNLFVTSLSILVLFSNWWNP